MREKETIEEKTYYSDDKISIIYSIIKMAARFWDSRSEYDVPDTIEFLAQALQNGNCEENVLRFLADITSEYPTEATKTAYESIKRFINDHLSISQKKKDTLIKMLDLVIEDNWEYTFTDKLEMTKITETQEKYKRTIKLKFDEDNKVVYKVSYKWNEYY